MAMLHQRVSHFFDATEGWKRERPGAPGALHRGTLRPAAASGAAARSAMRRSAVDAVAAPLKTWWFTGYWDGIERFLYGEVGKKWSFMVNCVGLMEDIITCVYIYIYNCGVCMHACMHACMYIYILLLLLLLLSLLLLVIIIIFIGWN